MTLRTFGPYELVDLLGRGGMGDVWRARDTRRGRLVALKLLPEIYAEDDEYLSRFRREQLVAARLREPHVIPIHDFGEVDGRLFIDMRLVDGENVGTLLERTGPLPPARAVDLVAQVAQALAAAHADGLVHRDVKPTNVLVTPADFVYVVDFGIARKVGTTGTALTMSGTTVGTLDYMAPERFSNLPIDARADVYSLACLLHECLTGKRPFQGDDLPALMHAHLHGTAEPASVVRPGVPPALDAVIAHGLAKDRDQRFPGTLELAAAAREALTVTEPVQREPAVASTQVAAVGSPPEEPVRRMTARAPVPPSPVVQQPVRPPVPPARPPQQPPPSLPDPADADGRRRRRAAITVTLSLLVVLAVLVAGFVWLTSGRDDGGSGTAQGSSSSAAPSTTPPPAAPSPSVPIPAAGEAIDVGGQPGYVQVAPNGRFAYIANRGAGEVTVLDTTLDKVTAHIPIAAAPPRFITFSPDGATAYVTVYDDAKTVNAVVFLDTRTNEEIRTIPVGTRPFAPATTSDGSRLYVPIHDEGKVQILDTATGDLVDEVVTPPNPHWIAFDADGATFWTADHESGVVTRFDTATHRQLAEIPVGKAPHSLALSPDGSQLSVVNYDSDTMSVIDTATTTVLRTVELAASPQDVTYAPDGRYLYVAAVEGGVVEVVDTATGQVTAQIPTGASPTSVSVLPDGSRAYVTNLDDGTVRVLDTAAV